ncbi:MAG: glutathione synthase, partial [Thiogranum sp.]
MTTRIGIVMDPIDSIRVYKDSSFAMLLAAQARGWQLFYMEQGDLYLQDGRAFASMRPLVVRDRDSDWYEYAGAEERPLSSLDVVLMRKDPPMDMEYLYTTYMLERAESEG